MLMLLLAPWPGRFAPVWLLLLALLLWEALRSQRRIAGREGEIALLSGNRLRWQQREWLIARCPWLGPPGIYLALRGETRRQEGLWLMRDSMSERDWRHLHQRLLATALPPSR